MTDKCAKCGHPRKEHSYNGACYGLCGEFVECSSAATTDLVKTLDLYVDGVRHYLHMQIGKPLSPHLISAPEIALDNLHREMKAAIQSVGVAQPMPDRELLTEVRTNLADNITLFSHHKAALLRLVDNALAAQPPAAPVETATKSAPVGSAPHNNGERLPNGDVAAAGADTRCSAGSAPVVGPNLQTTEFDDNSGGAPAWHKIQDQIDEWAQQTLPPDHAGAIMSWSDRLAQHLAGVKQ
jgi:hypothetical protein